MCMEVQEEKYVQTKLVFLKLKYKNILIPEIVYTKHYTKN